MVSPEQQEIDKILGFHLNNRNPFSSKIVGVISGRVLAYGPVTYEQRVPRSDGQGELRIGRITR